MRAEMWRWLDRTFAANSRLLDLGCGTGLDAIRMAQLGHTVTATDWAPQMVARTAGRAAASALAQRVDALHVGAHELHKLSGDASFDGAYSNLGPLNCVPDLAVVARECARLVRPGGKLVFTVVGRYCPWELLHYAGRWQWRRALVRFSRGIVPVGMNRRTIWTRYYSPREFHQAFRPYFALSHYRGLCVFAPPPYLETFRARHGACYQRFWAWDRRVAGYPVLRNLGDHFLMVMQRR